MVSPLDEALKQSLSAVMDGEATPQDWARVQAAWASNPDLRACWAEWQSAADGLRAPGLPALQQRPEALLSALHARQSAPDAAVRPRAGWLPPLAVAASFVALTVAVGLLKPVPDPELAVAAAPKPTPRAAGLNGLSFAQAAAGRTLPGDTAPEPNVIDWGLALPEAAASQPPP